MILVWLLLERHLALFSSDLHVVVHMGKSQLARLSVMPSQSL